jgi:hypothetical protein
MSGKSGATSCTTNTDVYLNTDDSPSAKPIGLSGFTLQVNKDNTATLLNNKKPVIMKSIACPATCQGVWVASWAKDNKA